MPKETSEEVAKLAATYINITGEELFNMTDGHGFEGIAEDIRTLAASCLSQREKLDQIKDYPGYDAEGCSKIASDDAAD